MNIDVRESDRDVRRCMELALSVAFNCVSTATV
jgi:hypothetical protein